MSSNSSSSISDDAFQTAEGSRTLVLCFDGSSNMYDADNTNVVKLFSLLRKDEHERQLCYYQPGIGTFFNPGVVSPLFTFGAKMLDLGIAWYLDAHVLGGYTFLMENWKMGDSICLFGFSRGAYTARALAGMLYKIGLLSRSNVEQVPFAYKLYTRTDAEGVELSAGFKETFCRDVKIRFLGVWDTVASVGAVMQRTLPFTNCNSAITTFRHALALDECRTRFRANYYHRPTPTEEAAALSPDQYSHHSKSTTEKKASLFRRMTGRGGKTGRMLKPEVNFKVNDTEPCDVLEVWFAGCHSDVGGGNDPNTAPHSLSLISLRWMVREIINSQCGIQFDEKALQKLGICGNTNSLQLSTTTPDLDAENYKAPLHDSLSFRNWSRMSLGWWLLELFPATFRWQDPNGFWHKNVSVHFGRGRAIVDEKPKFHISVKHRMEDKSLKYVPKARWTHGTEVYVD